MTFTDASRTPAPPPIPPLDSGLPLVLLPVRLETRFRDVPEGQDLLIRVYPDDIHIDTHEPELIDEEVTWGQNYWVQAWRGGGPGNAREQAAWGQLAGRFTPQRAAWIARQLEPRNGGARPTAPVADTRPLTPAPDFPSPARHASAWTRAPRVTVLPDRWIALGYVPTGRAFIVSGGPIQDPLAVGPQPDPSTTPPAPLTDNTEAIDPGMRWLIDFDAALQNGMAIRLRVPPAVVAVGGLTRLVVVGVKASLDEDSSAGRLAELFEAHHFSRGIEFTPPGTPTNNTPELSRPASDAAITRSYRAERGAPLFAPGSGANGDVAARALGVDGSVFGHVTHADDDDQVATRQMQTALWPATIGYFLSQRMFGLLNDDELARVRRHFIDYVRGCGPLPTLRIGKQPYGLLPVTSLDLWQPLDAADAGARATQELRGLRQSFRRTVVNVPRVRQPTQFGPDSLRDPDQDLVASLRMQPASLGYSLRSVFGPYFLDNFWNFAGPGLSGAWWNGQHQLTQPVYPVGGLPLTTPQGNSVFAPLTEPFRGPLVQADRTGPLQPNYIATLAAATSQVLRTGPIPQSQVRPLLYALLRHSLLTSYSHVTGSLLQRAGIPIDRQEPELIDISASETPTIWRLLERPVGIVSGMPTIRQFMDDPANAGNPDLAPLTELRTSLQALAQRSVGSLEQLLIAALDVCSHRLDAWITSLATRRLAALRTPRPFGALIGGYGWVENVRPATTRPSDGYIHAPSLSQASAMAVLASAHLSHRGSGPTSPFALDLSSERMRAARALIDAVRQGQPLAALVGYRLERGLHQQSLAQYIDDFRAAAPLVSTPGEPMTAPTESIAASNVVHGLDILDRWRNFLPPFPTLRTSNNLADFVKIDAIFMAMADQLDALGDLLVAEGVFQATRGAFDRTSATLDSVARGESVPMPEVLDTPRSGLGLTHRLVALFTTLVPTSGWVGQPRGTAEPFLNSWAAQLLGNTVRVRFRATYLDPATRTPLPGVAVREVRLPDLRLCPLDLLYLAPARGEDERGELEQRLRYFVLQTRPATVRPDADVRLDYSRAPHWQLNTIISLGEFLETAQAVRQLLLSARALGADDLALPEDSPASGLNIAELRARAIVAINTLRLVQTDLRAQVAATSVDLTALRAVLLRAAYFGVYSAVPVSAVGDTLAIREALVEQARGVDGDITSRLVAVDALTPLPASADLSTQRDREIERVQLVFGRDFLVLPRFKAANPSVLTQTFGASSALQGGNSTEAFTWLNRVARVREGAGRLLEAQRYADAMDASSATLTVGQLPSVTGERWVALAPTPDKPLPPGRLSIVTCAPLPPDLSQFIAGVVIDEWNEVVPSPRETTGLVFNFDEPDARAPHAILVAVAPDRSKPWDLDALEATLLETLELASLRLVDPDVMFELDHYLPALYFALNATDEAISTNFRQPAT